MRSYGAQSAVAPLKRCLLRRPDWNTKLEEDWHGKWGFSRKPDLQEAQKEHEQFANILRDLGVEVCYLEGDSEAAFDAIFAHDRALLTDEGAVILRSGKPSRQAESSLMVEGLRGLDIPIIYRMQSPMTADGGDFLWVRRNLVLAGYSYRTNAARQAEFVKFMGDMGVEVKSAPVPHWTGTGDVMHLTSFISLVDHDLAVAHRKIMAVETAEFLQEQGVEFVDVPDEEFDMGLGANVLAVAPRKCVMLKDYPGVRKDLEAAGAEVTVFSGEELSHCMKGGATCLTLALLREY